MKYVYKKTPVIILTLLFSFVLTGIIFAQTAKDCDKLRAEAEKYLMKGLYKESLEKYEEALEIAQKLNDKGRIAFLMGSIGVIYKQNRQYDKALDYYQKSVDMYNELGNKKYVSIFTGYMANVYLAQGKPKKALGVYEKALAMAREIKDKKSEAAALGNIGNIYSAMGEYKKAIANFEKAAKMGSEVGDKVGEGRFTTNMGVLYNYLGEYKKAKENYEKAAKIVSSNGDRVMEAFIRGRSGDLSLTMGDYDAALDSFEEALKISKEMKNQRFQVKYLMGLGRTFAKTGNMEESLKHYEKAREIVKNIGSKILEGGIETGIARAYRTNGKLNSAIKHFNNALSLYQEANSKGGEGSVLSSLARTYLILGENEKALDYFKKALVIAKERKKWKTVAENFGNIGITYSDMGKYREAVKFYEQAMVIAEKLGDMASAGAAKINIGLAYARMGDFRKAMLYYEQALTLAEKLGNREVEATAYGNLGIIYFDFVDYKKAYTYYRKALKINTEIGNKEGRLTNLLNLGALFMKMKKYKRSISTLKKALELSNSMGDVKRKIAILGNIGSVNLEEGNYKDALVYLNKALDSAKKIKDKKMEFNSLLNIGFTYHMFAVKNNQPKYFNDALSSYLQAKKIAEERDNDLEKLSVYARMGIFYDNFRHNDKSKEKDRRDKAIHYLKKSVDMIEKIRGEIKIEGMQLTFLNRYIILYDLLIKILLERDKVEEAFAYAERAKARMFLDSLGNKKIIPKDVATKELAEKEHNLSESIKTLKRKLSGLSGKDAVDVRVAVKKKEKERDEIIERIKRTSPEYAALITVNPLSLKDIQQVLSPKEAVIEYFTGPGTTYVWVVTKDNLYHKILPYGSEQLKKMVGDTRSLIIPKKGQQRNDEVKAKCKKELASLYSVLFKPIEPFLKGKTAIIVIPHRSIHKLPIAALVDENGKFLVEKYSLLVEPSASAMVLFRRRSAKRPEKLAGYALGRVGAVVDDGSGKTRGDENNIVIRGDFLPEEFRNGFSPLPGTREEINRIEKTMKKNNIPVEIFIEKKFTRDSVKNSINDAGIVHFATHGFLSTKSKGRKSGLLTADSLVYVIDIFNWNLNSDMVVLSACKTGLGDLTRGDDMISLSRAFMQAGADNIMASLWSVQDEATRDLMVEFYDNLIKGQTKADALRNAQLKLIKKDPDPYLWAPFVLSGKGN